MNRIAIYDTTLRDGAQGEGISFSNVGKIRIARYLDQFGVDYIEGGYPSSNPKDMSFFHEVKKITFAHAKITAFGSTIRANTAAEEDVGAQALLDAQTSVVTIFGKSWTLHVRDVLKTTNDENLRMIAETIQFLKAHDKEVIYDAEHFFDGFKNDAEYALSTLKVAQKAGADIVVLCDTNGGSLPHEVYASTEAVIAELGMDVGIHAHNDSEVGVANSLEAVRAGAVQVQGTINGFGERCGNANLISIVPNLILKYKKSCLNEGGDLKKLKEASLVVHELANVRPNTKAPFVGDSAFAHKAGMHVDGVRKNPESFEHIPPESVGNDRRVLISELSGRSNVILKAKEMGIEVDSSSPEAKEILQELERMEKAGYAFEAADASFRLLIQKVIKAHKPFFELEAYRVIIEKRKVDGKCISEASVKLKVNGTLEYTVAEADGPVDALNEALRKALVRFYPQIANVVLYDYRVRILDPEEHTAAKTRVLIESGDGHQNWSTIGVSENIIEASWEALVDSVEYKLFLDEKNKGHS